MSSEKKMRQNSMNALFTLDYPASSNDFLMVLDNIGTCIYTVFAGRQQNEAEDKTKRRITYSPQKSLGFFFLCFGP